MKLFKKYWLSMVLVLLGFTPLIWFLIKDSSYLINGLDTNFPLNPLVWLERRFFIWNGVINAGTDFSSSTAGIFFHTIQTIPYLLGFSLRNVEIISLVFWFFAIVISSYLLSKIVSPQNRIAQLFFVLIYSFNTYLFNTWENIKVANLSLMVALPLFIYLINSFFSKKINTVGFIGGLCMSSLIASGSGINPAYFSVIVLVIILYFAIFTITDRNNIKRVLLSVVISLFILFLTNIYWIFPLVNYLFIKRPSNLSDLGITDWLKSLSTNTSIINVFRLQGAWDWYSVDEFGMPHYLPYTLNYLYKFPFIFFSFIIPAISVISLIFVEKKKKAWYLFFSTLLIFGIFFGVGSHEPTGKFFLFLTRHIPFFSFYRSPWYIFTPILILSYSGLVSLFFVKLMNNANKKLRLFFGGLAFIIMLLYLVYNYPLITGKIFRPSRKDGFYVTYPKYLFDTEKWLMDNSEFKYSGRIITYPDDQLEAFNWGYRGTESILGLFSDIEFITPSFNNESKTLAKLIDQFYLKVKRGELDASVNILKFFGADKILNKNDASTISPEINSSEWKASEKFTFGNWDFLRFKENIQPKLFSPNKVYLDNLNYEAFVGLSSILPKNSIVVDGFGDTEIEKIPFKDNFLYMSKLSSEINNADNINNIQNYVFDVTNDSSYKIAVERRGLDSNQISLFFDSKILNYEITDDFIVYNTGEINKGLHNITIRYPESENLVIWNRVNSYFDFGELRYDELPENINDTLILYSPGLSENIVNLDIKDFNPNNSYLFEYNYKYVYGQECAYEFVQSRPGSKVRVETLPLGQSFDWEKKNHFFKPVQTESELQLSFIIYSNESGNRTKSFVENVSFKRVYDNQVYVYENQEKELNTPEVSFTRISPTKYILEIKNSPKEGYIISFLENYNEDWSIKNLMDKKEIFIIPHFLINGYANGWYIPEGKNVQKFEIYYKPQTYFVVGGLISIFTFTAAIFISLKNRFINKKSK